MVPPAPPSLVKLAASASAVRSGVARSTPTSDHVPDEM